MKNKTLITTFLFVITTLSTVSKTFAEGGACFTSLLGATAQAQINETKAQIERRSAGELGALTQIRRGEKAQLSEKVASYRAKAAERVGLGIAHWNKVSEEIRNTRSSILVQLENDRKLAEVELQKQAGLDRPESNFTLLKQIAAVKGQSIPGTDIQVEAYGDGNTEPVSVEETQRLEVEMKNFVTDASNLSGSRRARFLQLSAEYQRVEAERAEFVSRYNSLFAQVAGADAILTRTKQKFDGLEGEVNNRRAYLMKEQARLRANLAPVTISLPQIRVGSAVQVPVDSSEDPRLDPDFRW